MLVPSQTLKRKKSPTTIANSFPCLNSSSTTSTSVTAVSPSPTSPSSPASKPVHKKNLSFSPSGESETENEKKVAPVSSSQGNSSVAALKRLLMVVKEPLNASSNDRNNNINFGEEKTPFASSIVTPLTGVPSSSSSSSLATDASKKSIAIVALKGLLQLAPLAPAAAAPNSAAAASLMKLLQNGKLSSSSPVPSAVTYASVLSEHGQGSGSVAKPRSRCVSASIVPSMAPSPVPPQQPSPQSVATKTQGTKKKQNTQQLQQQLVSPPPPPMLVVPTTTPGQQFAGSAFLNSPDPTYLPLPVFEEKKVKSMKNKG